MDQLGRKKYYFTKMDNLGGVIQEATLCLLLGLNQARLPQLLEIV